MAQQQSFEHVVEDTSAASVIMRGIGAQVCEGMRTATWAVPRLGATCILNYYERRQVVIDGEWATIDQPHYQLHATYGRSGREAALFVRFMGEEKDVARGSRDLGPLYDDDEKQVFGKQEALHPDEASWMWRLLMQAGQEEAADKALRRPVVPPTADLTVIEFRRQLGWE